MKKVFVLALIFVASQLTAVFGQDTLSPFEMYGKWRREVLALSPGGVASAHHAIATKVVRLNESSARIEFMLAGKMSDLSLEIRPVVLGNTVDGGAAVLTEAGERTLVKQVATSRSTEVNPIRETTAIVPVSNKADALEIKWTGKDGVKNSSATMIVPLGETPYLGVVGIIPQIKVGQPASNQASFGDNEFEVECETVTLSNSTCGTKTKSCKKAVGHITDGVNCTITCGGGDC